MKNIKYKIIGYVKCIENSACFKSGKLYQIDERWYARGDDGNWHSNPLDKNAYLAGELKLSKQFAYIKSIDEIIEETKF